jgi:hypothetical protein
VSFALYCTLKTSKWCINIWRKSSAICQNSITPEPFRSKMYFVHYSFVHYSIIIFNEVCATGPRISCTTTSGFSKSSSFLCEQFVLVCTDGWNLELPWPNGSACVLLGIDVIRGPQWVLSCKRAQVNKRSEDVVKKNTHSLHLCFKTKNQRHACIARFTHTVGNILFTFRMDTSYI